MNISIQDLLLLSFNSAFNQNSNNGEQLFRRAVSKVMIIRTGWIDLDKILVPAELNSKGGK